MTILPERVRRLSIGIVLALTAVACTSGGSGATPVPTGAPTASEAPPASGAPSVAAACPTSQPEALGAGETRSVTIETELGAFVISVQGDLSPIAAGNFVALAECGFYEGVVFHRLVPGFVIQGGDPGGDGTGGPGYTIEDEPVTATYHRGTVAMARPPDMPDSQGSQFFVVLDDEAAGALAAYNTYSIFGEVIEGMDVVDAIAATPNSGAPANAALEPVAMDRVTVSEP
jgi:cyclophilin family peptidyl-prolyl cis-trans isomerase